MSVSAVIKDGKLVNGTSSSSSSSSTTGSSSTTSISDQKDQFMKLLVAQMKYQDPLEPTSNTEYIQQYATFSELEQMQNMSQNISLSRASDFVGKTVIVNTTNADGTTSQVEGKVDYVTYSSGEAYVNINGNSYNADNVAAVVDSTYKTQTDAAQAVMDEIDKLGSLQEITLSDATSINNIETVYEAMDSTTKSYIKSSYVTALEQYVARIKELQSESSASGSTSTDTSSSATTASDTTSASTAATSETSDTSDSSDSSSESTSTDTTAETTAASTAAATDTADTTDTAITSETTTSSVSGS